MNRNGLVRAVLGAAVFLGGLADAAFPFGTFVETQTISLANPRPQENLGYSLDVSGGLAIAGAINGGDGTNTSTGAAYVYRQGLNGQWNQVAKLLPNDGLSGDSFGSAVGIDGDWAIVEANFYHLSTSNQRGAAYIFHRNNDSDWQQVSMFTVPPNSSSYFASVSISGTQAVVSSDYATSFNNSRGVVDVLEQTGPLIWSKTQRIELIAYKSSVRDVAIDNGTLFIGGSKQAASNRPAVNSVEVYKDSPAGFVYSTSIFPPVASAGFGNSISVEGTRLLIGAPTEAGHGAAYIFEQSGDAWTQVARLVPSDLDTRFLIGSQVALHGDFAFVNSWNSSNGLGDGRVYVYQRNDLGNWVEIDKLISPFAQATFGHSLAAVDGQVLIGSGVNFPGAIHVFSTVPEPTSFGLLTILAMSLAPARRLRPHH